MATMMMTATTTTTNGNAFFNFLIKKVVSEGQTLVGRKKISCLKKYVVYTHVPVDNE